MNLILAQIESFGYAIGLVIIGLVCYVLVMVARNGCSHEWDMWQDKEGHDFVQERECRNCGEKESRRYDPDMGWD